MDEDRVRHIIEEEVKSCQIDVYGRLKAMEASLAEQVIVRSEMRSTLDTVLTQAKENHMEFKRHDEKEMEKYDMILEKYDVIVDSINDLTTTMKNLIEQTARNSEFVDTEVKDRRINDDSRIFNEKMEKEVAERMLEIEAPAREAKKKADKIKEKVIMTAIGVVTTAIVVGVGSAVYAGMQMWFMLGMDKV